VCVCVLPGCDALGYIGCTGTNVCIRARCLAVLSMTCVGQMTGTDLRDKARCVAMFDSTACTSVHAASFWRAGLHRLHWHQCVHQGTLLGSGGCVHGRF
jgi:hypothetical protein